MKLAKIVSVIWLAILVAGAQVCAEENKLAEANISSIHIQLENPGGNYTVIYERMVETGTGAVLFGMVGAVANSAQNNMQDDRTADKWRPYAEMMEIGKTLEQALRSKLASSSDFLIAADPETASHKLEIEIKDWGLIRKSQETQELRAFININVRMEDQRGRLIWQNYPNRVGKFSSADWDAFTEEVFVDELTKLSAKVGESVAYEIIYR